MATVREALFNDLDGIIALMNRSGLEFKNKSRDEWYHIWNNNPALTERQMSWPMGWVIEDEDRRVVGFLGNIPLMYQFMDKRLIAADATSMAVDVSFRSYSILLLKNYFTQPYVDLFLNTGANYEAGKIFSFFKAKKIPQTSYDKVLFWVIDYKKCVREMLRKKGALCEKSLTAIASFLLQGMDVMMGRGRHERDGKIDVECVESFDERFDLFWNDLVHRRKKLLLARDRQSLSWHFKYALMHKKLWILATHRASRITNYALFLRQDNSDIGLKRMRLVDFQSIDDNPSALLSMIAIAIQRCKREGIHILEAIGFDSQKRDTMKTLMPRSRNLPIWPFFYKAKEASLAAVLKDSCAWDPCLLDGDASL